MSHKFNLMWSHNLQEMRSKFKMSLFHTFVCSNIAVGDSTETFIDKSCQNENEKLIELIANMVKMFDTIYRISPRHRSYRFENPESIHCYHYHISHGKKSRFTHMLVHACSFFICFAIRCLFFYFHLLRHPVVPPSSYVLCL